MCGEARTNLSHFGKLHSHSTKAVRLMMKRDLSSIHQLVNNFFTGGQISNSETALPDS